MSDARSFCPRIEVAAGPDGALLYLVDGSPAQLPAVRGRDLLACWEASRQAARRCHWGPSRRFRFVMETGAIDIALEDADACCWAGAVDARSALDTHYGLSLCLRLLALIEVLTRSSRARRMVTFEGGTAELRPALVAAAAAAALGSDARFDEIDLLAGLGGACELLSPAAGPRR